jgi:hypothetical protein
MEGEEQQKRATMNRMNFAKEMEVKG